MHSNIIFFTLNKETALEMKADGFSNFGEYGFLEDMKDVGVHADYIGDYLSEKEFIEFLSSFEGKKKVRPVITNKDLKPIIADLLRKALFYKKDAIEKALRDIEEDSPNNFMSLFEAFTEDVSTLWFDVNECVVYNERQFFSDVIMQGYPSEKIYLLTALDYHY